MYPYLIKGNINLEEDDFNLLRKYFKSKALITQDQFHGRLKATSDGPGLFGATLDLIPLDPPFKIISTYSEFDGKFHFIMWINLKNILSV